MATTDHPRPPAAVSVHDAAGAIGISPTSMRRRIRDGTIRAVRIGGRVVVPTAEIARVLGLRELPPREATR
jgi:predicted site-specific integrase-resolvase